MSTPVEVPLPSLENHPAALFEIKRIQMFVLPACLLESNGYRVCLRLSTANGHGWSELFIKKSEKPCDWIRWSSMLLRFIGTLPLASPFVFQTDPMMKDERIFHLFAAAALHIESNHYTFPNCEYDREEHTLFKQAISYVSLF